MLISSENNILGGCCCVLAAYKKKLFDIRTARILLHRSKVWAVNWLFTAMSVKSMLEVDHCHAVDL